MKIKIGERATNFLMGKLAVILAMIFGVINYKFNFVNSALPGVDKVFDSVVNFTSIIIGVLIALFGVVITITDKDIMVKLQKNRGDKTIFIYSIETLLSNFALLILTIILQSLISFETQLSGTNFLVQFWFIILIFSVVSSIRTIFYLLLISFNQNDRSKRPKSNY